MMSDKDDLFFNLEQVQQTCSEKVLFKGNFGLEREGLRVLKDGKLALTPHPSVFGSKLTNPFITTDFSESQIEVITPICGSVKEAYRFLEGLCRIVEKELPENEYFWPQSMPCDIPKDDEIPIAHYAGDSEKAEEAMTYRRQLIAKYGGKKQLISGIHYNFSLDEETIEALYQASPGYVLRDPEKRRLFKDSLYLKMIRGFLRYRWLIIYLTGSSAACHQSFMTEKMAQDVPIVQGHGCFQTTGPSLRNSVYGYKNLTPLFPNYNSVEGFVKDVRNYISEGIISSPKEIYAQVRMKARDPSDLLNSLLREGIRYIELRTVDINPFEFCGISLTDMTFIHHFLLWSLTIPEAKNKNWQAEALKNEELTALRGFEKDLSLFCDGKPVILRDLAEEILLDMLQTEKRFGFGEEAVIETMLARIRDPKQTYGKKLMKEIEAKGFLESQLERAFMYKEQGRNCEGAFIGIDDIDPKTEKEIRLAVTTGNKIEFNRLTGK